MNLDSDDDTNRVLGCVWDIDPVSRWVLLAVSLHADRLREFVRAECGNICEHRLCFDTVTMDTAMRAAADPGASSLLHTLHSHASRWVSISIPLQYGLSKTSSWTDLAYDCALRGPYCQSGV